jgi:hypothetical protein
MKIVKVQPFMHKGIMSAFKMIEYVSDRMSYILLRGRGRWCTYHCSGSSCPGRS